MFGDVALSRRCRNGWRPRGEDLSLESDFQALFTQPDDDLTELNDEALLQLLRDPHTVMAGSDVGVHVGVSIDAEFPTTLLGRWWGFHGRGLLHEGRIADVVVFDPKTVGPNIPDTDDGLPGGSTQLRQQAIGIKSVIVAGQELLRDNQPTGALPGRLVRSAAATC